MNLRRRWDSHRQRAAWKRKNPETYYAYLMTTPSRRVVFHVSGWCRYQLRRLLWRVGLRPGVTFVCQTHAGHEYWRIEIAGRRLPHIGARDIYKSDPCAFCGGPQKTLDHIIPRSKGGPNRWWNLTPCCYGCNQAKGSRSLLHFLATAHRVREQKRAAIAQGRKLPRAWRRQYTFRVTYPSPSLHATIAERVKYVGTAARDRTQG